MEDLPPAPSIEQVKERLKDRKSFLTREHLDAIKRKAKELLEQGIDVDCLGPVDGESGIK